MDEYQGEEWREKNQVADSGGIVGQFHGHQPENKTDPHLNEANIDGTDEPFDWWHFKLCCP
jgi:hypothetical protein